MQILRPMQKQGRRIRRPVHNFRIQTRPWQITPFFLAPVLPGETLRNLVLQARSVTDPLADPLNGWHYENYIFYVRHRQMPNASALETIMLDPTADLTSIDAASDVARHYVKTDGIDWVQECLEPVVRDWFRAEGEAWNLYTLNSFPVASYTPKRTPLDSVIFDADYIASMSPADTLTVGVDDSFTAEEIHDLMQKWYWQREHGLLDGNITYEDWLRQQGVNIPKAQDDEAIARPELVRYWRNWTYPSNTIDPTDGSPSSACSWSLNERADKDRFFSEPGFLFGVCVYRPKVYLNAQASHIASQMKNGRTWLPKALNEDPYAGMLKITAGQEPFTSLDGDAYWIDIKDSLFYGDQFVNYAFASGDPPQVTLPGDNAGTHLNSRYPQLTTDQDVLFATTTAGVGKIEADGVVTSMIATHLVDRTGTTTDTAS